ncbi:unnamed protein product, partial [Owenia fusiformis]
QCRVVLRTDENENYIFCDKRYRNWRALYLHVRQHYLSLKCTYISPEGRPCMYSCDRRSKTLMEKHMKMHDVLKQKMVGETNLDDSLTDIFTGNVNFDPEIFLDDSKVNRILNEETDVKVPKLEEKPVKKVAKRSTPLRIKLKEKRRNRKPKPKGWQRKAHVPKRKICSKQFIDTSSSDDTDDVKDDKYGYKSDDTDDVKDDKYGCTSDGTDSRTVKFGGFDDQDQVGSQAECDMNREVGEICTDKCREASNDDKTDKVTVERTVYFGHKEVGLRLKEEHTESERSPAISEKGDFAIIQIPSERELSFEEGGNNAGKSSSKMTSDKMKTKHRDDQSDTVPKSIKEAQRSMKTQYEERDSSRSPRMKVKKSPPSSKTQVERDDHPVSPKRICVFISSPIRDREVGPDPLSAIAGGLLLLNDYGSSETSEED